MEIWSIGHGTLSIEAFVHTLVPARIALLADVRSFPGSRRHPQFGADALSGALAASGIEYVHLRGLGGRREPSADSPHVALRVSAFRGYADHMATDEFARDYERLFVLARERRTAFMCAETLWWRCHRRMLADRLTVDGWRVVHLRPSAPSEVHRLWDVARVEDDALVYDGGAVSIQEQLSWR